MSELRGALNIAADDFLIKETSELMKVSLASARERGMGGWYTDRVTNKKLIDRAKANLEAGDYLDAINLLSMVLLRENEGIE